MEHTRDRSGLYFLKIYEHTKNGLPKASISNVFVRQTDTQTQTDTTERTPRRYVGGNNFCRKKQMPTSRLLPVAAISSEWWGDGGPGAEPPWNWKEI